MGYPFFVEFLRRSTRKQKEQRSSRRRLTCENLERRDLLAADPILSEFVASNDGSFQDGFGGDTDWIEIQNIGDAPIDLMGYHLTDDAGDPFKWEFATSTIVDPGEFLVAFASGFDTVDPLGYHHTSFSLKAGGEHLSLTAPDGTVLSSFGSGGQDYPKQLTDVSYGNAGSILVDDNSLAYYLMPEDASHDAAWMTQAFDAEAAGFFPDRASFGNETKPADTNNYSTLFQTDLPFGSTSAYLRIPFAVADTSQVTSLNLNLHYDDGFVAYLNGTKVAESNAPTTLAFDSVATAENPDVSAIASVDFNLDSHVGLLQTGDNLLAIHALNRSTTSSDFLMIPELSINAMTAEVGYLQSPTPGGENASTREVGPLITDVTADGTTANAGQTLTITATVDAFVSPVVPASIQMHYRAMYGAESVLAMVDTGANGDAVASDGVYTAQIPGSALVAGGMIRWYVTAADSAGAVSRAPSFLDPIDSAEYFGTLVLDPSITTDLPRMHWFLEDTLAADEDQGTRASLYYRGKFYDNIRVDHHGRGENPETWDKKSYDFDANSGDKFDIADGVGKASDFNLLTNYRDQTKLRHTLAYELFADAGYATHLAEPVMVYRNGAFHGLYDIVEEGDSEYLKRLGLGENNPLYKVHNRLDSASMETVEKKSRKFEDYSDFQELVDSRLLTGNAADQWDYDNFNIADVVNYLAVQNVIANRDFGHKNMWLYRDTEGTGLWSVLPWDLDLSLGHKWGGSTLMHFENTLNTNSNIRGGWNSVILKRMMEEDPRIRSMFMRRMRTLMDEFYGAPGTSTANSHLAQKINYWEALIADEAVEDADLWGIHPNFSAAYPFDPADAADQLLTSFIPNRRTYLEGISSIPNPQVGNPTITIHQTDFDAGLDTREYIRLVNSNNVAVDISGWTLAGGIEHEFRPGTVIPANESLYVVGDVVGFKGRTSGPRGGQELFIQGNYQGNLSSLGETVQLKAADGAAMSSLTTPAVSTGNQEFLRVTEINYNPPGNTETTEFIEFSNTSAGGDSLTLDLSGVTISQGLNVPFVFPNGTTLNAGQRLVVVNNQADFLAFYSTLSASVVAGEFAGNLANRGGTIRVDDSDGTKLVEIKYNDREPWSRVADGAGGTLELTDESGTPREELDKYYSWHGSKLPGGTPAGLNIGVGSGIVINEVIGRTTSPAVDAIELMNTSTQSVSVGGWYLSDSEADLLKFQIPANTILQPGEYLVFDETDFNPNPSAPGPNDFALNGVEGDDIWLVTASGSDVAQFVDQVEFDSSFVGESWGRVPNGSGRLLPMAGATFGSENTVVRQANVVISEVNFSPQVSLLAPAGTEADDLEFVEIFNNSATPVDLTDWRLRGEVDFDFAPGTTISGGQTLLVTSFDPNNATLRDAFVANYGLSGSLAIVGFYDGKLSNSWGRVELERPDGPSVNTPPIPPLVMEDEVIYDDLWAPATDGAGDSLHRSDALVAGIFDSNWTGQTPSPGTAQFAARLVGDYDRNGIVEPADYDVWSVSFNSTVAWNADGNGNGIVDAADFTVWRDNLGATVNVNSLAAGAATVVDVRVASPIDALRIINFLSTTSEGNSYQSALDTNRDGEITSLDALLVINRLNDPSLRDESYSFLAEEAEEQDEKEKNTELIDRVFAS